MADKKIFAAALIVAGLGFFTHINSVWNNFIYDDYFFIVENDWVKDIRLAPYYFTQKYSLSDTGHNIYRPLRTLSFALDYILWGLNPFGYHLGNVVLHAVNSALLFVLFKYIFGGFYAPLFVSAVFASHPVQVETVAWISSRGELLYVLFFILSIAFYLKSLNGGDAPISRDNRFGRATLRSASLFFFALSLFSKESAVALPLVLISYDLCFGLSGGAKKLVLRHLPYMAAAMAFVAIRFVVLGELAQQGWWGESFARTMMMSAKVFLYYFRLIFIPGDFRPIYKVWLPRSVLEPMAMASLMTIGATFAFAALGYKRRRRLFALLWYFLILLPVSNIVPIKGLLQEHFLYLPIGGLMMALALTFEETLSRQCARHGRRKWAVASLIAAAIVMAAAQSAKRDLAWRDGYSLWSDAALKSPGSFLSQSNYGVELYKRGAVDRAFAQFHIALFVNPGYERAHYNIASIYYRIKKWDKAVLSFKMALLSKADYVEAYNGLGAVFNDTGQLGLAAAAYRKGLSYRPDARALHYNLGLVYYKMGELDRAIEHYGAAASWRLDYEARHDLAVAYNDKMFYHRAIKEYKESIRVMPEYARAYSNLGAAYHSIGKIDRAIESYNRAIVIEPTFSIARGNLGVAYMAKGSLDKALKEHKEVLAIDLLNRIALFNLAEIYARKGFPSRATFEYLTLLAHGDDGQELKAAALREILKIRPKR